MKKNLPSSQSTSILDRHSQGRGAKDANAATWFPFLHRKDCDPQRQPREASNRVGENQLERCQSTPALERPVPRSIHHPLPHIDEEGCCDESSVVSEITHMTYSVEKAEMVVQEFVRRVVDVQRANGQKMLTREEKETLLDDVQREQDLKLRWQRKREEEEERLQQRRRQMPAGYGKGEIFEGLHGMRLKKQARENEEGLPFKNDLGEGEETLGSSFGSDETEKHASGGDKVGPGLSSSSRHFGRPEERHASNTSWIGEMTRQQTRQGNGVGLRLSVEFAPSRPNPYVAKHCWEGDEISCHGEQEEAKEVGQETEHGQSQQVQEPEESLLHTAPKTSSTVEDHIDEIIELKMLVATQQATIDTLSAKLHNLKLELANRPAIRRKDKDNQVKMNALQAENRNLAEQLRLCQEREASWRTEATSRRTLLEDFDSEQIELEEKNLALMRENSALQRRLRDRQRRCSDRGNAAWDLGKHGGRSGMGGASFDGHGSGSTMGTSATEASTFADSVER